jgi:hypothetical protein
MHNQLKFKAWEAEKNEKNTLIWMVSVVTTQHTLQISLFSIFKTKIYVKNNFCSGNYTYQKGWFLLSTNQCVRREELTKICLKEY